MDRHDKSTKINYYFGSKRTESLRNFKAGFAQNAGIISVIMYDNRYIK